MKKTFIIPVRWELCSTVEVEAETVEEAIELALKFDNEVGYEIPNDGEYIDGSWEIEVEPEFVEPLNKEDE